MECVSHKFMCDSKSLHVIVLGSGIFENWLDEVVRMELVSL